MKSARMPHASSARQPPRSSPAANPPKSRSRRLTHIAFILSLALVACRLLMSESIRSPFDQLAGEVGGSKSSQSQQSADLSQTPASPGPATGLTLDLLFCIPALLVLARRVFDREYSLAHSWSIVPM